jgi:predicted Zn-dependent protease
MIISEAEAKQITQKALSFSKADSASVRLRGHERGNIRFALNSSTTNGFQDGLTLSVEANFGKRSGSASTNEFDDRAIEATVRKAEENARLAPENAEFQPPLGPQEYLKSRTFFESTAGARAEKLAALCAPVVQEADRAGVTAAGFLEAGAECEALATSNGLFVFEPATGVRFTVSARTSDGTGSGWAGQHQHDITRLNVSRLGKSAVHKTAQSRHPVALDPGKHTVILEPAAVCDLLGIMIGDFEARSADEGRSFFTKKGGGNKLGEKLFGDNINLYSDPHHELTPGSVYSGEGLPVVRRDWIKEGVVNELAYSRFWAKKMGREPVPHPTNLIMNGGNTPIEEMIRNTKRGVLVTRFWYIREVDPRSMLFTGLTRDGTFLIEDGKISKPVKNFRFNESPIAMLGNIEAMGPSERTTGSEVDDWPVCVPPLLVKDFNFASLSDAV